MFVYEKKLQYPVRIARPDPAMASRILSQYGGPDGELGASLRYLSQRYTMPCGELKALLTDIGTEELGHLEIVGAMVQQLTRNLSCDDIVKNGFDAYFVDHGIGVYPASAAGVPYHAAGMQSKGDALTDLHENLAADAAIMQEQQAPKNRPEKRPKCECWDKFSHALFANEGAVLCTGSTAALCVSQVKTAEAGQLAHKGLKQRV